MQSQLNHKKFICCEVYMHYHRSQRTFNLLPTLLSKSSKSANPPPLAALEPKPLDGYGRYRDIS